MHFMGPTRFCVFLFSCVWALQKWHALQKKPKTKNQNAKRPAPVRLWPLEHPTTRPAMAFQPLHLHLLLDTLRPSAFPPDLIHSLRRTHPEARARVDGHARTLRIALSPAELDLETPTAAERPPAPFSRTDLACLQLELATRFNMRLRAAAPLEAWLRWFRLPPGGLVTLRVRDPEARPSLHAPNDDEDEEFYDSDEDLDRERDQAPPGRPGFPYLPLVTAFERACSPPQRAALRQLHLDHARLTPVLLRAVRATWPGLTTLCLTRPRRICRRVGDDPIDEASMEEALEDALERMAGARVPANAQPIALAFDNRFCGLPLSRLLKWTHLTTLALRLDARLVPDATRSSSDDEDDDRSNSPSGDFAAGLLAVARALPHLRVLHLEGSRGLLLPEYALLWSDAAAGEPLFPAPLHTLTLQFEHLDDAEPGFLLRQVLPAAAPHLRHLGLRGVPPPGGGPAALPPLPALVSLDLSFDVRMQSEVAGCLAWIHDALPAQLRHLRLGEGCALLPSRLEQRLTALETLVFESTAEGGYLPPFLDALLTPLPELLLPALQTLVLADVPPALRRRQRNRPQEHQRFVVLGTHSTDVEALFPTARAKYPNLDYV
jgi:hypothetical protein